MPLEVTQLHTCPLFLGQLGHYGVQLCYALLGVYALVGVLRLWLSACCVVDGEDIMACRIDMVYGYIAACCDGISLDGIDHFQLLTVIPQPYHCLLNDILGLLALHGDTQRQTEQFVFQREYVVLEVHVVSFGVGSRLLLGVVQSLICVPLSGCEMFSARVMTTLLTPALTACRAFSILGSMPPDMVPSSR